MHAGIDLGATNCGALIAEGQRALGRASRSTPRDGSGVAAAVGDTLRAACEDAGVAVGSLDGVGAAVAGPVEEGAGRPTNVPVDRVEPSDVLPAGLDTDDLPVWMVNDAAAGALAEQRFAGAPPDAVYLTFSTGIGAGAVVDGHVLSGVDDAAAELGHVPVGADGRECTCGGRDCWEAYCAGRAIPDLARSVAAATDADTVLDLEEATAREVLEAVGEDPVADAVRERLAAYNARGLAVAARAYAPALVSVGGAVALAHTWLLEDARDRLPETVFPAPELRITPLGHDAGLWGAVAAAVRDGRPPRGNGSG